ncbi:hypothetical protein L596_013378 [Steinernema carpocapsae]|uniref:Uncharacterized protein n=1 Tax=Steinernema carpocapsae TaxID=34508 RepID=A0A4U5P045_STECR|nr:hypothetical protein L596_013378 [Steinernema carpocapsae]
MCLTRKPGWQASDSSTDAATLGSKASRRSRRYTEAASKRKWSFAWKMANTSAEKWPTRIETWRPPTTRLQERPELGDKRTSRSLSSWCNRECENM